MAHTEGSQILAQMHWVVAAYHGATQNSSGQSPVQSSVVFAGSEEELYMVTFQSPFPWNQVGYFLVVKAGKELWKSLGGVSLDSPKRFPSEKREVAPAIQR